MTAWTPYWLSSSSACCGGRLLRCRRVVTFGRPGFSVKGSGTKWRIKRKFPTLQPSLIAKRAVFPFHPVRGQLPRAAVGGLTLRAGSAAAWPMLCALPAKCRSVVAALARAIHGGYQGFTLPLRFNGRPYRTRTPYVGDTRWTSVIEDVWEHMAEKRREMQGHGEASVPHVVEFQENHNGGLIIQFYDYDGGLVHTYKDPSSEFKYRIIIKDAPKKTTVWTVIGVDEDNWWNEYAPGLDCMKEFAPGPHYDPSAQVNVLCTGKQVDDAMCSDLFAVAESRQRTSNSVVFIGAGVLGRSSWLDRQIVENFEKVELRTDYPWGEVVQRIARKASQWKTQMIVEVPPEAAVHQTKQYKMLTEDELWVSIKIDGCTRGQRLVMPLPDQSLAYCKVGWEYLAANIKIWPKLSDKCRSNHTHASQERMHEHAEKGRRTSQVCRRLLNALQFRAPNEGRLVSMPVSIPKGRVDRVIVTLDGAGDGFAERKGAKGCARIRCRNHWVPAHVKTSSSKRSANPAGTIFTRLCYSWHRFCDQAKDLERLKGGKVVSWGEVQTLSKCVEISQTPTEEVCGVFQRLFSLDTPTSCSCWSWPELLALVSSSKVKRVKVADHDDATGELIGRRIVLSNMPEVERLETNFSEHVSHKSECSSFRCIDDTWRSVAVHVRSLVHAHVRTSRRNHDADHDKRNRWCRGTDSRANRKPQTMSN